MSDDKKIEFVREEREFEVHCDTLIETIAAACHQQNRTYCQLIGDTSQPNWSEAPDWQKNSCIAGVKGALDGNSPAESHASWLEQKRTDGWVYGETKDAALKTHPCMVPYGDLPEAQKRKDGFYVEMVQQLGLASGLLIRKNDGDDT